MPNWTTNTLEVLGSDAECGAFLAAVTNPDGTLAILDNLLPMPAELEGAPIITNDGTDLGPALTNEGLAWRLAHWGTKWSDGNTERVEVSPVDVGVCFVFDTPWSAPLHGIQQISERFPTLRFIIVSRDELDDDVEQWVFVAGEVQ